MLKDSGEPVPMWRCIVKYAPQFANSNVPNGYLCCVFPSYFGTQMQCHTFRGQCVTLDP